MQIDNSLRNHMWNALKWCLSHMTNLLKNRHLDQIIICNIYGVCKILDEMNFDFRTLIDAYQVLANAYDPSHDSKYFYANIIHKVILTRNNE